MCRSIHETLDDATLATYSPIENNLIKLESTLASKSLRSESGFDVIKSQTTRKETQKQAGS